MSGAVGTNVANLVALVALLSVNNRCAGVAVVDVDRGQSGASDAGIGGGLGGGHSGS